MIHDLGGDAVGIISGSDGRAVDSDGMMVLILVVMVVHLTMMV